MDLVKLRVLSNERLTEEVWRLTLETFALRSDIKPGQFVNLRISETNDPLFRRPFSVFRCITLDTGIIALQLIYQVVGRGTMRMTSIVKDDELDMIGPLGHGFELYRDKKIHVLLAGGIGAAGLFMLGEKISEMTNSDEIKLYSLLGTSTKKRIVLEKEYAMLNGELLVSSEDGTYGYKGTVVDMLQSALERKRIPSDCAIYACGPESMYKALAKVCQCYDIEAQVSLERNMMCGIGACLCCTCAVNKNAILQYRDLESSHIQFIPNGSLGYALVCRDGPVFKIDEVLL